jgi:segregation and condensation protein B
MNDTFTKNVIEAALLAAGRPLTIAEIGQLFDESSRPGTSEIRAALEALAADYTERGIEVKETANGFRIQVKRELANEISRLWPERPPKYSRALLETLALIAYRQPITRAEIEAVRGVAVNPNIVKTLLERNWVKVVGQRDVPGRPELLGTTRDFLDYFGLRSLDELPPLSELKAMGDVNLQLDLSKEPAADAVPSADGAGAAVASAEGGSAAEAVASAEGAAPAEVAAADAGDIGAADAVAAEGSDAIAEESDESDDASDGEGSGESPAVAEGSDSEVKRADAADGDDSGPKVRAAQAFVAEMENDDPNASDDDDDELSEGDRQGSSELVAAPPFNYED